MRDAAKNDAAVMGLHIQIDNQTETDLDWDGVT